MRSSLFYKMMTEKFSYPAGKFRMKNQKLFRSFVEVAFLILDIYEKEKTIKDIKQGDILGDYISALLKFSTSFSKTIHECHMYQAGAGK